MPDLPRLALGGRARRAAAVRRVARPVRGPAAGVGFAGALRGFGAAEVTRTPGVLNTLLREVHHHLHVHLFGRSDTPHTRGFRWTADALPHLALGTPAEKRKPLVWIRTGTRWRIDWTTLR